MIVPNKVVTLKESALGLTTVILDQGPDPIELTKLYSKTSKHFESIDLFILTIDLLYVLGRVEFLNKYRELKYVV